MQHFAIRTTQVYTKMYDASVNRTLLTPVRPTYIIEFFFYGNVVLQGKIVSSGYELKNFHNVYRLHYKYVAKKNSLPGRLDV